MINIQRVDEAALEIMKRAAIDIPEEYRLGIQAAQTLETG